MANLSYKTLKPERKSGGYILPSSRPDQLEGVNAFESHNNMRKGAWAVLGVVIGIIIFALVMSLLINNSRRKKGKQPIRGTSWIIPPSYWQSQTHYNSYDTSTYVPKYTETANENDLGYYDYSGRFHPSMRNDAKYTSVTTQVDPAHQNETKRTVVQPYIISRATTPVIQPGIESVCYRNTASVDPVQADTRVQGLHISEKPGLHNTLPSAICLPSNSTSSINESEDITTETIHITIPRKAKLK